MGQRCEFKDLDGTYLRKCFSYSLGHRFVDGFVNFRANETGI